MTTATPSPAYMTTSHFEKAFFTYIDGVGLSPVPGTNAANCPAGRVLQVTRRKLHPGIHTGVKSIMTGVYDIVSQFSGFIDANSAIFSLYSPDLTGSNLGLDYAPRGDTQQNGVEHKGQSVYTLGDVVAGGQFYSMKTVDLGSDPIINADLTGTTYYTITLKQNTTLSAIYVPPNKGTVIFIEIYGDGVSTLYFSQNFSGSLPQISPNMGKVVVEFISDGSTLTSIASSQPFNVPVPPQIVTF